jgi:hypothetical protein
MDLWIVFFRTLLLPLTPYNAGLIAFKSNDSSKDSRYDFACKDDGGGDDDVLVFDDGCGCGQQVGLNADVVVVVVVVVIVETTTINNTTIQQEVIQVDNTNRVIIVIIVIVVE